MGPGPTTRCGPPSAAVSGMDQCVTVERELEKVLHKFSGYGQLCERGLEELIDYTGGLKHEILQSHGEGGRAGGRAGVGARRCRLPVPRPRWLALLARTHPETRWPGWVGGWGEQSAAHGSGRGVLRGRAGRRCASDQWGLLRALSSSSVSEILVFFFFPTPPVVLGLGSWVFLAVGVHRSRSCNFRVGLVCEQAALPNSAFLGSRPERTAQRSRGCRSLSGDRRSRCAVSC